MVEHLLSELKAVNSNIILQKKIKNKKIRIY
jgi:hypothetical protein